MMTKTSLGCALAIVTFAVVNQANAANLTINFDDLPAGTFVTNQYAALGVTFSSPGGALASPFVGEASSQPNYLVGLDPSTQAGLFPISADFATDVSSVSVTLISVGNATVTAKAFARSGSVLESIDVTNGPDSGNGFGRHNPIILREPGIARVAFAISKTGAVLDGFGLDDFAWSTADPSITISTLRWNQSHDILKGTSGYIELVSGRPSLLQFEATSHDFASAQTSVPITFAFAGHTETQTVLAGELNPRRLRFAMTTPDVDATALATLSAMLPGHTTPTVLIQDTIVIRRPRSVNISVYPIGYVGQLSPLQTITNGLTHARAIFPVTPSRFNAVWQQTIVTPPKGTSGAGPTIPREVAEARRLWNENVTGPNNERVIAIAPDRFFSSQVAGFVFASVPSVAFVREGWPLAVSHELGHTYGECDNYDLTQKPPYYGDLVTGEAFLLTGASPQPVVGALNFMGAHPDPALPFSEMITARWSSFLTFNLLQDEFWLPFESTQSVLRLQQCPPSKTFFGATSSISAFNAAVTSSIQSVAISGYVSSDGTVTIEDAFRTVTVPTSSSGDDLAVRLRDRTGAVLSEVRIGTPFFATDFADIPQVVPYVAALPDHNDVFSVEVQGNGRSPFTTSIAGVLLRSAVDALPDAAFTNETRRQALLREVADINRHIMARSPAAGALIRDSFRVHVEHWLADDYVLTSNTQRSKSDILTLVDMIANSL